MKFLMGIFWVFSLDAFAVVECKAYLYKDPPTDGRIQIILGRIEKLRSEIGQKHAAIDYYYHLNKPTGKKVTDYNAFRDAKILEIEAYKKEIEAIKDTYNYPIGQMTPPGFKFHSIIKMLVGTDIRTEILFCKD